MTALDVVKLLSFYMLITNGESNNETIVNETTKMPSTSTSIHPFTSTMFHTPNSLKYFIDFQVVITFQCVISTDIECENVTEIKQTFNLYLNDLNNILMLTESIKNDEIKIKNDNEGKITINCTIYTNNMNDFDDLKIYINSSNFSIALQEDLDDNIDGIVITNIKSIITNYGDDDDDDDDDGDNNDDKPWYDGWLDPLNYDVFQWVVISLILFFLILCIAGCSWWCCCKKTKDEKNSNFMKNPHRYDSEFPGQQEMQVTSFSIQHAPMQQHVNWAE